MPKRSRTSPEAKQGVQFRDLPESIVKEHLLPFLRHSSWYDGHQFVFEQLIGVGERMSEHGSWKHAGFQWARDSHQALRRARARHCHTLFLGHVLCKLYMLQGLPLGGDLFKVEDIALRLLPKEEARRSILTRYKVASFQRKLLVPRSPRSFSRLVHDDLVEAPLQPEAHEFTTTMVAWM